MIRAWKVSSASSAITTSRIVAPSSARTPANRSWVSGRSGESPCSFIAIAFASQGPIQIGRKRRRSRSLRITTCWVESMCTRTLSTAISTMRPAMARLSHARSIGHPARTVRVELGYGAGVTVGLGLAVGFAEPAGDAPGLPAAPGKAWAAWRRPGASPRRSAARRSSRRSGPARSPGSRRRSPGRRPSPGRPPRCGTAPGTVPVALSKAMIRSLPGSYPYMVPSPRVPGDAISR